jgi:hypothetical protein
MATQPIIDDSSHDLIGRVHWFGCLFGNALDYLMVIFLTA